MTTEEQYKEMVTGIVSRITLMLNMEDDTEYEFKTLVEFWNISLGTIYYSDNTWLCMGDDELYLNECPLELLITIEKVLILDTDLNSADKYSKMWKEHIDERNAQKALFISVIEEKIHLIGENKEINVRPNDGNYTIDNSGMVTEWGFALRTKETYEIRHAAISVLAEFADTMTAECK